MYRRRRYTAPVRRAKRPSDRIIRAASGDVPATATTRSFVYTASVPQTARSIKLDVGATTNEPIAYALVYLPEGYDYNPIVWPAISDDLYNPTKNVLISGVLTDNSVEDHKTNRIGRKLATGDRIALLVRNTSSTATANFSFELSFTALF